MKALKMSVMSDFEQTLANEIGDVRALLAARQQDHGNASQTFKMMAIMATWLLRDKLQSGKRVTQVNVADIMAIMKVARLLESQNPDSRRDLAGYALLGGALLDQQRKGETE